METGNAALDLALDTLNLGKQALVFANTKKSAEKTAEDIAGKIKTNNSSLDDLSAKILKALSSPTKQCQRLALCIKKGIAFHHAGLVAKQRELIEDNFKSGAIKIICSTPSLAMGVDLPAYRAIIKDLKRYGSRGMAFIPVLEYLQMAGRAGRPKFDKSGEAMPFSPIGSANEKVVSYIEPQAAMPVEFELLVDSDAASKAYKVPLNVVYSDFGKNRCLYLRKHRKRCAQACQQRQS